MTAGYSHRPKILPEGPVQEEWFAFGACRGAPDPDLWFPESGVSPEAERICAGCQVRDACGEYALRNREKFGIWGGLTESKRRSMRRRRIA